MYRSDGNADSIFLNTSIYFCDPDTPCEFSYWFERKLKTLSQLIEQLGALLFEFPNSEFYKAMPMTCYRKA